MNLDQNHVRIVTQYKRHEEMKFDFFKVRVVFIFFIFNMKANPDNMQLRVKYLFEIMKKPICMKRASVMFLYVILNLSFELEPKIALLTNCKPPKCFVLKQSSTFI